MSEKFENIIAVLTRESLQQAFKACENEADVLKLLAEQGVDITESELKEALMQQIQHIQAEHGELSEEALEKVAGGWSWGEIWSIIWRSFSSMGQGTGSHY